MEVILNKRLFLNKFLIPINKFTDQAIINLDNNFIDCISFATNEKQSIILYTKIIHKTDETLEAPIKLNIGSIKKLISALSLIKEDIISLKIENNSITYKSEETNFRFHLKEDGILEKNTINIDKINKTEFETNINLVYDKINELIKANTFATDTNKVYITIKNDKVYCELTDKNIANLDTINIILSNKYTTTCEPKDDIILKLDVFKIISSIKFDECLLKINSKGVIMFDISDNESVIKYITTSLIK